MANPEHLALLKRGVRQWNEWREQQWSVIPDLSKANLAGAFLLGADLSGANLRKSLLGDSNMNGGNLSHADLSEADLQRANLSHADLSEANLNKAFLLGTKLFDTNLFKTNLSEAKLYNTIFADIDFRTVKGISRITHGGPSLIMLHTVQLPQDGSALHFLRGCGVPDEWIDDYCAHMMHPIQYHSCFISYTHQDNIFARHLHAYLQDRGVRCWFAPHDMKIGDKIRSRIDQMIHQQDKLLLILSEHSVVSDWVEHEVETALAREHKEKRTILFPIRLDNAILEREYTGWAALVQHERHIGDFTNWSDPQAYQQAFDRLLRDLKSQE